MHIQGEEGGYFDGAIGGDNGDATYRVDFDDGDVLDAAPRRDMNVIITIPPAVVRSDSTTQPSPDEVRHVHPAVPYTGICYHSVPIYKSCLDYIYI